MALRCLNLVLKLILLLLTVTLNARFPTLRLRRPIRTWFPVLRSLRGRTPNNRPRRRIFLLAPNRTVRSPLGAILAQRMRPPREVAGLTRTAPHNSDRLRNNNSIRQSLLLKVTSRTTLAYTRNISLRPTPPIRIQDTILTGGDTLDPAKGRTNGQLRSILLFFLFRIAIFTTP